MTAPPPSLEHQPLGVLSYDEAVLLQRAHRDAVLDGAEDRIFTVEHSPCVLTAGRRAHERHLLRSRVALEQDGIQLRDIERGGDWTFHGPGQLVAYPVVA